MQGLLRRGLDHHPRPTAREVAVARRLLSGEDRRLQILTRQFETAREVERVREGDAFRVGPAYTTTDLMFTFDAQRAESRWLRFTDVKSGRELDFRVVVVRGGFLKGLEGRTVDGNPWPEDWAVDPAQAPIESEEPPYLVLPSEADIAKAQEAARSGLIKWLGLARLGDVETFPPASEAALAARELEVGLYSPSYRAFLAMTDGFESHLLRVLGYRDSYPLDSVHIPALLVAWDADDQDDYVVAIPIGGSDDQVYRIDVHDESALPRPIAPSLGAYLARRLTDLGLAS
jgi:hypothetical protein